MKKIIYLLIIAFICLIILTTFIVVLKDKNIPEKKIVNSKKNSIKNSFCGDGVINGNEKCDGNSILCIASDGYSGTKTCSSSCSIYGSCVSTELCGDGVVNGNEECDGTPKCNSSCKVIIETKAECGNYFCEGRENYFNCPRDCNAPEQQSFQPVSDYLEKSNDLLNNQRIRNAIEANPLVDPDSYMEAKETILQKIREIGEDNTESWNDYRNPCPNTPNEQERKECPRDIYLRKVALSIYVEINKIVPWSILDYSDDDLTILLGDLYLNPDRSFVKDYSSYYISRDQPRYNGNPMLAFEYIEELKGVYPNKLINTQKDLLDLMIIRMRDEGWIHASSDDPEAEELCGYKNYDFECVIKWKKGSDIHMSLVIYALLQSHNVPSVEEPRYLGEHTGIIFPSLKLVMKGNNVYTGFKGGMVIRPNSLPVYLTFLDLETYNEWNKLDPCEAAYKDARKDVLNYLDLYDNPQWNDDIKAYYCLDGAEPGAIMKEDITNGFITWICKPQENPDAIGEMKPPLTEQELVEWIKKIAQIAQC